MMQSFCILIKIHTHTHREREKQPRRVHTQQHDSIEFEIFIFLYLPLSLPFFLSVPRFPVAFSCRIPKRECFTLIDSILYKSHYFTRNTMTQMCPCLVENRTNNHTLWELFPKHSSVQFGINNKLAKCLLYNTVTRKEKIDIFCFKNAS